MVLLGKMYRLIIKYGTIIRVNILLQMLNKDYIFSWDIKKRKEVRIVFLKLVELRILYILILKNFKL